MRRRRARRWLLGEHANFGSVTVPFNRLGGLQMLNPNYHEWEYVKPQLGCAIINLDDAIVKLVHNGLYSGVHSIVGPLGDQAKYPEHSVARPNSDAKLGSLSPSCSGPGNNHDGE
jgi:isopenicillin N synthase-like dioxygenase